MRRTHLWISLFAVVLGIALNTAPAQAQATRTWVSGVGDDANPCSRTAPCKTFAGAISKTAAKGEINVLDPGGFGGVTITKSITISSEGFEAGVLVSGTNGITVNTLSTDNVVLRGLDIEGVGTGLNGINFLGSGVLHVEKSVIHQFTQNGINFAPNASGAELYVTDTQIRDNGASATTGGISFKPTAAAGGNIFLQNVRLENNSSGVIVDGSTTTAGSINATLSNVTLIGSANSGISAVSIAARAGVNMMVDNSMLASNAVAAITSNGATASGQGSSIVRVGRSTVSFNATAMSMLNSGQTKSFGNNEVVGNGGGEAFNLPNLNPL